MKKKIKKMQKLFNIMKDCSIYAYSFAIPDAMTQ